MKKNSKNATIYILLILLISYILNANLIIKSILNYTKLFITKLFPATFIIYIISSLLIDYGIINILSKGKINGNILYVTLMSLISGFPSGAKYTKELLNKNLITVEEANYLITYTNFPNPIFVLGSISTILNKTLAVKILISLIISNLIIALILKPKEKTKKTNQKYIINPIFSISLANASLNALKTLVIIYSTSLFFYLIVVIITKYITFSPLNYVIINCLFDLTKGIFQTSIISNTFIKTIIILILLSFGNLSIHNQIKSIISDTSIKYNNYLLGRIIQTIFSLIFLLLF